MLRKQKVFLSGKKAFTLIEVLIVLVVLGVVGGLAVNSYNQTVEQTRRNEAITNLKTLYYAEKVYSLSSVNNNYWWPGANPPLTGANSINTILKASLLTRYYDVTSITGAAGAPPTLTITLQRNNTERGNSQGVTCTITETGPNNLQCV